MLNRDQGSNTETALVIRKSPSPPSSSVHPVSRVWIFLALSLANLEGVLKETSLIFIKEGTLPLARITLKDFFSKKTPPASPATTIILVASLKTGERVRVRGAGKISQDKEAPEIIADVPRIIIAVEVALSSQTKALRAEIGGEIITEEKSRKE